MSAFKRVEQWTTFTRTWWLYDAKWQDPFKAAPLLCKYLKGMNKPIWNPKMDCGDHIVVINSQEIALKADEWFYRTYFHHTGYPGGATWTKAFELHAKDPTMIIWKACYRQLSDTGIRRELMHRLHIFKDDKVPEKIMENVTHQIRPLRKTPKRLDEFTEEEVKTFPKLWDYPEKHVIQ